MFRNTCQAQALTAMAEQFCAGMDELEVARAKKIAMENVKGETT